MLSDPSQLFQNGSVSPRSLPPLPALPNATDLPPLPSAPQIPGDRYQQAPKPNGPVPQHRLLSPAQLFQKQAPTQAVQLSPLLQRGTVTQLLAHISHNAVQGSPGAQPSPRATASSFQLSGLPSIRAAQAAAPAAQADPNEIIDTGRVDRRGRKIELTREAAAGLEHIFAIAEREGIRVEVTSAHRSVEHQARLFERAVRKYGSERKARKWVAPPGKSRHNSGKAIDLHMYRGENKIKQAEFDKVIEQAGMYRPMSWEGWHIEPVSTQGERGRRHHHHNHS